MKKRKGRYVQLSFDFKPWDDEEIWKDIPNYEGLYQASNLGRIKSLDKWVNWMNGGKRFIKGRILKPYLIKGYQRVCICKNGKNKYCFVHRLVYETFIGEIPKGLQVNHKDENPQNNILSNIDTLMTCKENINYGTRTERMSKTKSKPVVQKSLQGEVIKIWPSAKEIQRVLGYSHGNICDCCNNKFKYRYGYLWQYTEEAV